MIVYNQILAESLHENFIIIINLLNQYKINYIYIYYPNTNAYIQFKKINRF